MLYKIALLLVCMTSFEGLSNVIEVCASCEINSIKKAVELAQNGDTILIKEGVYKENNINVVDKSIRIVGENHPVVDGEMKGSVFSFQSNNFSIEGLKIINVGRSYIKDFAAIVTVGAQNFSIKNNILENVYFGILLEKSSFGTVENNQISSNAVSEANSGNGIHLWYSKNIQIKNNRVNQMRDGIYIEFGNDCLIENNIATNNVRYGLHFMFSNNNDYLNNTFEQNGAGVAVMFSRHIRMIGNTFRKSWGDSSYGILLKEITDSELTNNVFDNNTIGINADGASRIVYKQNDFHKNGYAVKVHGACYNNTFVENNFLHNAFDVSFQGNINQNVFDSNYWTAYSGYDLDKDGVGDVPYRPVKLFSYLVNTTPEAIVLLRSLFMDIIDFSEKVSPVFTPADLIDNNPKMKKIEW